MIARPIRRPHPIPFEAPHLSSTATPSGVGPVAWAAPHGTAMQAANQSMGRSSAQTNGHVNGHPNGQANGHASFAGVRPTDALAAMNRPIARLSPVLAASAVAAPANDATNRGPVPSASASGRPGAAMRNGPNAQGTAHNGSPNGHNGGPDGPRNGQTAARYMGHGSLSVRSSVTGRHYRFQGHGDSQFVDKHDVMLLRRIPDLVLL